MSHSEEGENYWPGYVDALTSMVQVLAFVMMMLAMAVFALSQSATKHAVEAIAKAVKADIKPNADVKQMTQAVLEKIQNLTAAPPPIESNKPEAAAAPVELRLSGAQPRHNQTPVQISPDAPRLTLEFEERSFKIDQQRAQSLGRFIDENHLGERAQAIAINAYAYSGDGALTEARRLGYYRAMVARKQLLDAKVKPENIRISVNDTIDKDKASAVEVIITGGTR